MKDYYAENEKNASDIFESAFLNVLRIILNQLQANLITIIDSNFSEMKICRSGKGDGYICFYLPAVFMQMGMLD